MVREKRKNNKKCLDSKGLDAKRGSQGLLTLSTVSRNKSERNRKKRGGQSRIGGNDGRGHLEWREKKQLGGKDLKRDESRGGPPRRANFGQWHEPRENYENIGLKKGTGESAGPEVYPRDDKGGKGKGG